MSDRLTVVLWKWRANGNWKRYASGHVNAIVSMVDAYCDVPCDFVLITDDPDGVDRRVRCLPLERVAAKLPQMANAPQRNAYRRVGFFNAELGNILGRRRMQIDLDTVFVRNFTALASRPEPFVIWKSPSLGAKGYALNPSFILHDAGAERQIYDRYIADPVGVATAARAAGFTSTDQSIISYLAENPVTVDERDGIVSFRDHLERGVKAPGPDVCLVSFMDRFDPADPELQERCPWIADHYHYRAERIAA